MGHWAGTVFVYAREGGSVILQRGYLFWGGVLVLLGGWMFLDAAGFSLLGYVQPMQLFGPSVLVWLGLWLLANHFWRGRGAGETLDFRDARGAIFVQRINPYLVLGLLCLLGGGLGILQAFGFLQSASEAFWGLIFLAGGLAFLVVFVSGQWWAALPALALAGMGILILLPAPLEQFGGMIFLGAVGVSFWLVYLTGRERWWAILPGGVALTLAAVSALPEALGEAWLGMFFFAGLALTFLLVALLAGMRWAYWPALALGMVAVLAFLPDWLRLFNYAWAVALIGVGAFVLWRSIRR